MTKNLRRSSKAIYYGSVIIFLIFKKVETLKIDCKIPFKMGEFRPIGRKLFFYEDF